MLLVWLHSPRKRLMRGATIAGIEDKNTPI